MKETIKFSKLFLILVLMGSVILNGCKKDEDEGDPPDLPPGTALLMDFSAFEDQQGVKKSVETYENYPQAFWTVFTWDILAAAVVLVPTVAYAEAFNHDPVYKGNNSWEWTYTLPVNQVDFTARLVSKRISNEEFTLKFYVTTSAPVYTLSGLVKLDDFLWFEGTVRYDGTQADWILYEAGTSDPLLAIEWEKDWEENTGMISYEIIKPGDPENGSFIEQGHTVDPDYNAYFTVFYESNTTEIQWETVGYSGRIKGEHLFGDTDWHCWDENKMDDLDCQ